MRPTPGIEAVWRRYDAVESRLTAAVSERMLDLAELAPGMCVLDVATGRGEPALRAARRVGPTGRVVGVDLSTAMLAMTREKAEREGLSNLELHAGDVQRPGDVPALPFHAATARWGLMYMADPVAALANVRRVLSRDGPLVAACWAEPERVPYYTLPRRLLERYRPMPALDPRAPGTFRLAELDRIVEAFDRAGLALDHVEEMETPVFEAETGAEIVAWVGALGPKELTSALPEPDQRAYERDLAAAVEAYREDGRIRLGGVTRIVRARPI